MLKELGWYALIIVVGALLIFGLFVYPEMVEQGEVWPG